MLQPGTEEIISGSIRPLTAKLHELAASDAEHVAVSRLLPHFGHFLGQEIAPERLEKIVRSISPEANPRFWSALRLAMNVAELRNGWERDLKCIIAMTS